MKTPGSGKDITGSWLEYILGEHLDKPPASLKVVNFTVGPGAGPGDGFNSELVKVTAEMTEGEDDKSIVPQRTTTFSMIAKFESLEPMSREINRKMQTNQREYVVYKELMRNLNTLLISKIPEEPKVPIPKLIYGKLSAQEYVLVMENVKTKGYETNDKRKGLDWPHLLTAIDSVARLHALSYVYDKSHDIKKEHPCIATTSKTLSTLIPAIMAMLHNLVSFLKSSKETEALGQKIEDVKSSLLQKCLSILTSESPVTCLIHGDLWNNNLMYKHKDTEDGTAGEIEDMMLIDWGQCSFGSPIYDLQYIVYTSTTRQVRQAHLDELLRHYHSTFMRLVTLIDAPPSNWDYEQFIVKWKEFRAVGFLFPFALILGTLSTTNPANKKPEPSVLDKPYLALVKALVNGMKSGLAKVMAPIIFSSVGRSMVEGTFKRVMKPVVDELMSGKNEVLNTRLLDLVYEADEDGVFVA